MRMAMQNMRLTSLSKLLQAQRVAQHLPLFATPFHWQVACALALSGLLCWAAPVPQSAPSSATIEGISLQANQGHLATAEQQLRRWAKEGFPVAQRELGLLLLQRDHAPEAREMLQSAAQGGDAEGAFQLAESLRTNDARRAWPWYEMAANRNHAKAALALARMAKNGDGHVVDSALAVRWLQRASALGNGHAMFLLANAYRDGDGLPRSDERAHYWLEQAAEHDVPAALHALAMELQDSDSTRAALLFKEAREERHNNWNTD